MWESIPWAGSSSVALSGLMKAAAATALSWCSSQALT